MPDFLKMNFFLFLGRRDDTLVVVQRRLENEDLTSKS